MDESQQKEKKRSALFILTFLYRSET